MPSLEKVQVSKIFYPAPDRVAPHMTGSQDLRPVHINLKQWRMLHAVIDCGGFAEAAKFLHISQSTISYSITNMQEQLGTALLRTEGRKARLTEEGKALLNRSRELLKDALELEDFAIRLGRGLNPEVRLAVDPVLPTGLLLNALQSTGTFGGDSRVYVSELASADIEQALRDGGIDVGVGSDVPVGFLGSLLLHVEHLAVMHPGHPLARASAPLTEADLRCHMEIVLRDAFRPQRQGDNGSPRRQYWKVGSVDAAIEAVRSGLGYAWLPRHRIRHALDSEALVPVPLAEGGSFLVSLFLIHQRPFAVASPAQRLSAALQALAASREW